MYIRTFPHLPPRHAFQNDITILYQYGNDDGKKKKPTIHPSYLTLRNETSQATSAEDATDLKEANASLPRFKIGSPQSDLKYIGICRDFRTALDCQKGGFFVPS
jgi:hypothetical protein